VDVSTPLLPAVVAETDANWASFDEVEGQSRLELDSPVCKIRRMRRLCCFRFGHPKAQRFSALPRGLNSLP